MNFEGVGAHEDVEADPLAVMLGFSGFNNQQVVWVQADGFEQLEDIGIDVLEEQDIKDISTSLGRLPATGGWVSFGIARTKRLIGMMHWIQNHERVSLKLAGINGTTQDKIREMWSRALERANTRKAELK